ncbi:hypothetical protein SUDANB95_03486 [Actinosynnema sp. ALI-1.44]
MPTGLVVLVHGLAQRATAVAWALFAALLTAAGLAAPRRRDIR